MMCISLFFFFSSRRRHTRCSRDWSSDVCSSDLLGPLGAVQSAGWRLRAPGKHRQGRIAGLGWGASGAERLPPPGLRRPLPATGTSPSLFLQTVRAGRPAEAQGRCAAEGCGDRYGGPRPRHGAADGDVRESETMRVLVALALMGAILGSRSPIFSVVILPADLRGLMSALWVENNRHWDELADQNTLTQLLGTGKPTQREYLGCLVGDVAGDTLFVRRLVHAENLKQLQFAVAGDCDGVERLVGTFHTHPYRADPAGRAVKERGLSAMDLKTFAAAPDMVTMVMWDLDSLDVATKAGDGSVRHPVPLAVR